MAARTYDHRIREAIVRSRNPNLFPGLKIPRSTARAWIRRGERHFITLEPPDDHTLRVQLSRVEAQISVLRQVIRLLLALVRLSGAREFTKARLPNGARGQVLLRVINKARDGLPLNHALSIIGIAPARYHA